MRVLTICVLVCILCKQGYCQRADSTQSVITLHLQFIVPYSEEEWPIEALESWIVPRVQLAEQMFNHRPALKLTYEILRQTERGDLDLQTLVFRSNNHFHRYMKRHFPIVAQDSTKGFLPIIISEKFQILRPKKRLCGKSFLPTRVKPFARRHGIALKKYCAVSILAHELGHVFGLKHTYEHILFRPPCNKGYRKGKKGKRDTANYEQRTINLMDLPIGGFQTFLNECQKKIAAKERQRYVYGSGNLNYYLFRQK